MVEMMQLNEVEQLSPEVKRRIDIISQLKLGPEQQSSVILVLLGLKPATELTVYRATNDPEGIVASALTEAGLDLRIKKQFDKGTTFAVARDEETINHLMTTFANEDHEAYGRLMGYPETAIHAFLHKEELMDPEEEQKIFEANPDIQLGYFRLSKDHFQDELKTVREWNQAIKTNAPTVYDRLSRSLHNE